MLKAVLLLLVAMASIQGGATVAKRVFHLLGPAGMTTLRVSFAALFLWIIFRPWRKPVSRRDLLQLAIYGGCLGLMNLSFYYALERIPLGLAVTLEFTGPLAVAILSSRKKIDFLWAILAGIGIYLILPGTLSAASLDPIGILLAVVAGAFWAGYILFGKKASLAVPGTIAATWGMTFAAAVVLPVGLGTASLSNLSGGALLAGIGVAVLSSALPYTLEIMSLKEIPTKTFGVLMSLEPVIAALAGFLFLREELTILQWFAIFLIMLSSLGSTVTAK